MEAISNIISDDYPVITKVVDTIIHTKGKVVVTGIGKSAIIAKKMVATLNSTGTSSAFLHTGDALHGDLGVLRENDIIIYISKSGMASEFEELIRMTKSLKIPSVCICSNGQSPLALNVDHCIYIPIMEEADPQNLAPTASTIAHLAICDAIAIATQEQRGFTPENFAILHPGGMLGKQLNLKVKDIAATNEKPSVSLNADLKSIIYEMSSKRLGACVVVDDGKVSGIITDGDIRRMLEKDSYLDLTAKDIMSLSPKCIVENRKAIEAFPIMKEYSITQLVVVDGSGYYVGMIHIHNLIKEGLTK